MTVSSPTRRPAALRPIATLVAVVVGAGALSGCLAEGATEFDAPKSVVASAEGGAVPVPSAAPRADDDTKGGRLARAERPSGKKPSAAADDDGLLVEAAYAPAKERMEALFAEPGTDGGKSGGSISGSRSIDALIEKHARENGIPPALAYGFVRVESRYNPGARGHGVYGLSQIKPSTARGLGFSGPATALLDADTNLRYGMRYLAGAWQKGGGDVCMAAMKYKGGHRATRMTKSTLSYCAAVKREMAKVAGRSRMPAAGIEVASAKVETPRAKAAAAAVALTERAKPVAGTAAAEIAAAVATPEAKAVSAAAPATPGPRPAAETPVAAGAPAAAEAKVETVASTEAGSGSKGGRVGHGAEAAR